MYQPHKTSLATFSCNLAQRIIRGDATLAGWLQIEPAALGAGVAIERFIECVAANDRTGIEALLAGVGADFELEFRICAPGVEQRQVFARASVIGPSQVAGAVLDSTCDHNSDDELRNPLAPILDALKRAEPRSDYDHERERKLILRQVESLVPLVEDLLNISRITRGQLAITRERIELSEIVQRATATTAPLVQQNRHQLVVDIAPGLVIDADPARMTQVVASLMSNAARYTPVGGRITVTGALESGNVVLHVDDNGLGIASCVLPRIFDAFVQANPTADRSHGLGLGLAIVQSYVVLHGGGVEVHSEGIGRGSRFTVRLPRSGAPAIVPARSVQRAARGRVVVVDDQREGADVMTRSLQLLGYDVETAAGPSADAGNGDRLVKPVAATRMASFSSSPPAIR